MMWKCALFHLNKNKNQQAANVLENMLRFVRNFFKSNFYYLYDLIRVAKKTGILENPRICQFRQKKPEI